MQYFLNWLELKSELKSQESINPKMSLVCRLTAHFAENTFFLQQSVNQTLPCVVSHNDTLFELQSEVFPGTQTKSRTKGPVNLNMYILYEGAAP